MKPIAILQHEPTQGPGVLLEHLAMQGIPHQILCPPEERSAPRLARDYSGVVVLGSNHGVNEHLPWMHDECRLLQDALRCDVPVLGHCFGAQMLARAMGARVRKHLCPNIGWSTVWVTTAAQRSMDLPASAVIFHWHYDTFDIPSGATRTMYSSHCLNKGFQHGRHWAFQGHLEVTAESIRQWCRAGHDELLHVQGPAVQTELEILRDARQRIACLHGVALNTYGAWTRQLDRPALVAVPMGRAMR